MRESTPAEMFSSIPEVRNAERTGWQRQKHEAAAEQVAAEACYANNEPFAVAPRQPRWEKAFNEVVRNYVKCRNSRVVYVQNYDEDLFDSDAKLVRALRYDFVVDTELVATRALVNHPTLWEIFRRSVLQEHGENWHSISEKERQRIAQLVGNAYKHAGLFPIKEYFSAIRVERVVR